MKTSIILLIAIGAILYANTFSNEFVWDDDALIKENTYIKSWHHISDIFSKDLYYHKCGANYYRPTQSLSFMLDYHLWRLKPFGYHLTNMILHILCACILFFLINTISNGNQKLSLITSLIFITHPVHTQAVTYISGRADPLAGLFFLLSIFLYIKSSRKRSTPIYLCSIFSFILALLSKESALVLPFVLMLYDAIFNRSLRSAKYRYMHFFTVIIAYISLRLFFVSFRANHSLFIGADTNLYLRFLTSFKITESYLRMLFFPLDLHMDRSLPWADSILNRDILLSIILLTLLLVFTFRISKHSKIALFGTGWFLINLFPVSGIPPLKAVIAEHWMYLPSIGLFLAITELCLKMLSNKSAFKQTAASSLFIIIITFFSITTINRNRDWKNPIIFYQKTLQYVPDSPRLHNNIGNVYMKSNQIQKAIYHYKKAIELKPDYAMAYNNLGLVYSKQGEHNLQISCFKKAIELKPDYATAYNNLGLVYDEHSGHNLQISYFKKAIELRPDYATAYNNLGVVYGEAGEYNLQISCFKKAVELKSDYAEAYYNLGIAYGKSGKHNLQISCFKNAIKFKDDYTSAYNNLASIYEQLGELEKAVQYCEKAIKFNPDNAMTYYNLGAIYDKLGKLQEAIQCYEKSISLSPDFPQVYNNLGADYVSLNRILQGIQCYEKAIELSEDYAEAYNNIGAAYGILGQPEKVIRYCKKAIELKPDYADAHRNLEVAYSKLKKEEENFTGR